MSTIFNGAKNTRNRNYSLLNDNTLKNLGTIKKSKVSNQRFLKMRFLNSKKFEKNYTIHRFISHFNTFVGQKIKKS